MNDMNGNGNAQAEAEVEVQSTEDATASSQAVPTMEPEVERSADAAGQKDKVAEENATATSSAGPSEEVGPQSNEQGQSSTTLATAQLVADSNGATVKVSPNRQGRSRTSSVAASHARTGSRAASIVSKAPSLAPQAQRETPLPSTVRQGVENQKMIRASRFTLWETKTRYYLVGYNTAQTRFRILKIDRMPGGYQGPVSRAETRAGETTNKEAEKPKERPTKSVPQAEGVRSSAAHTSAKPTGSSFWELGVTADQAVYDRVQIAELLDMISEGNKSSGGLKEVGHFFGLVGFIRFTSTYYMVLISRRSVVALVGGHYIYHCDETKILPVCHPTTMAALASRTKTAEQDEARLLHTFKQVDLSKNFYFSYTYDLTRTLQENLTGTRANNSESAERQNAWGYSEKFIWNHHLLLPAFGATEQVKPGEDGITSNEWVLPLCYGFVDQAKLSVMNRTLHVTLIARRSRHFAGARFLKRGANEAGQVANDVETEQIVSEALTTPFFTPRRSEDAAVSSTQEETAGVGISQETSEGRPYADEVEDEAKRSLSQNPRLTSYVMHRGSIPIYWTQDSTNMSPRPPIEISVVDPYYSAAALHFDDMFARYGAPVIILNLIKSKEKTPRESKLLVAFGECIAYLNQFLPADKKIIYVAWDMSRASKSRDQDVIGVLEDIAEETVDRTRFFHSGPEPTRFEFQGKTDDIEDEEGLHRRRTQILLQTGVARVNCVDCLDRTNAAQFVIGKAAFGHQLHALGLLEDPNLPFDSDAVDMLTEMYHDLGDTIALQYGGSHLVNTMETYRKINQWTSHSRDMLEGLKRYYANSFVDADKQAAINLFLGIDRDTPDFSHGLLTVGRKASSSRRSYQDWYTPENIQRIEATPERLARLHKVAAEEAEYFWDEYYRPGLFTDLMRHHAFKMTAVHQHQPPALAYDVDSVSSPTKRSFEAQAARHRREASTSSQATRTSPGRDRHHRSASASSLASTIAASDSVWSDRTSTATARASGGSTAGASAGRRDSAISVMVTSPFTSRLPSAASSSQQGGRHAQARPARHSSSVSGSSAFEPSTSSSSASTLVNSSADASDRGASSTRASSSSVSADPKAIIGGVRRWMSLNHAGESRGRNAVKQRVASVKLGDNPESTAGEKATNEAATAGVGGGGGGTIAPGASATIGGWTNPFTSLNANPNQRAAEVLLEDWENPKVDGEEAREYALWLSQFKGNVQLEGHGTDWDALVSSAGRDGGPAAGNELSQGTGGSGGGGGGLQLPYGVDPHLSDADLQLYVHSVRKARLAEASLPLVPTSLTLPSTTSTTTAAAAAMTTTATTSAAGSAPSGAGVPLGTNTSLNAGHQATLPPPPTANLGLGGGMPVIEEVMKVYAGVGGMSLEARLRATNEAKVKNFRNWLTVGLAGR